jgi:hypothetical protein
MKLGIGLPSTMAHEIDRELVLDWARIADEAGFHVLGTIDQAACIRWTAYSKGEHPCEHDCPSSCPSPHC